jgi:hypothetical protein
MRSGQQSVVERLSAEIGADRVPGVAAWLQWVLDNHSIEVDDNMYAPSLGWVLAVLRRDPRT